MKMKRLVALLLMLCLVVCMLPSMHAHAATEAVLDPVVLADVTTVSESKPIQQAAPKQMYMTLEEAGAYVAQKMVTREVNPFPVYFKVEGADIHDADKVNELLLNEVFKHTGNGKLGDVLRWAYDSNSYGGSDDYHDGTAYYAHWESCRFTYYSSAEQEQELDQKVVRILNSLNLSGKSDYEKIKAIYEYVCINVAYAEEAIDGSLTPDAPEYRSAYSAYGALCRGRATCQGFSSAIYRLMLDAGIDCRLIAGDDHGWNIVELDGKYYFLDATWDSDYWRATGELQWFLKGSANFRDYGHREWDYYASDAYKVYDISELDYGAKTYAATDVIASGDCGDMGNNVTWKLTGDGTMTLTGTGNTIDSTWLYAPWQGYNGYIKKLIIGEGITGIGSYMFYNCSALTQIQFPSTLKSIGAAAFSCCDSLTELTLPNSITQLGSEAFAHCFNLKKIVLPNGVKEIPYRMLMSCIRLEEVTLGSKLTTIGTEAFSGCAKLKGISFPASLTSIGDAAFSSAFDPDLKVKLVIPKNVTYVGNTCFAWSYLNEVDWQAATPNMEYWTFYNCRQLEKVTLSDYVTFIGDECFQWNISLNEVKLSANLQTVGVEVFGRCTNLKTIVLPASLAVGERMFSVSGLESVVISEGIAAIGDNAFEGSKLKEVTLPSTLKKLGTGVFVQCVQLTRITFLGDVPQTSGNEKELFHNVSGDVYYPYGNATWTAEVMERLTPETTGLVWRTKHPAGAEHIPIITYQMQYDETGHWWECRGCDEKAMYEEHTLSEMTQDGDLFYRYCTTCWAMIYYTHAHSWMPATCTTPKTCITCGETEGPVSDEHVYDDYGYCYLCGVKEIPRFDIATMRMQLKNELQADFAFMTADLADQTGCYAIVTQQLSGGATRTTVVDSSAWYQEGSYTAIPYTNMAAKEMTDTLSVVIYNADGQAVSYRYSSSLAEYAVRAYNLAANKGQTEAMDMYVSMLYYGAAAQTAFKYKADHKATDYLTSDMISFARTRVNLDKAQATGSGATAGLSGSRAILESNIQLQLGFDPSFYDGGYTATYSYVNHLGETVEGSLPIELTSDGSRAVITVDDLVIADCAQLVTIRIYNAKGARVIKVFDSVENFAIRMTGSTSANAAQKALAQEIMNFSTSAYNYFH